MENWKFVDEIQIGDVIRLHDRSYVVLEREEFMIRNYPDPYYTFQLSDGLRIANVPKTEMFRVIGRDED